MGVSTCMFTWQGGCLASLAPLAKGVVVTIFPEEPLLLIRHVLGDGRADELLVQPSEFMFCRQHQIAS